MPVGDRTRWAAIARRFELFGPAGPKHHHGEDITMWPLLAERGAIPPYCRRWRPSTLASTRS